MATKQDKNFDTIAHKFSKNIYGSMKGQIREHILWQDLDVILAQLDDVLKSNSKQHLNILDAGCGGGQLSLALAKKGHFITLCDVSSEMLKVARHNICLDNSSLNHISTPHLVEERGIAQNATQSSDLLAQFEFIHSPIQSLSVEKIKQADLILFHAVMEWLADPKLVLNYLLTHMKDDAIISVMFYNQHGLVYKNITCGNLPHILQGMPHKKRFKLQPTQGLYPEEVDTWVKQAGFLTLGKTGIRCVYDYIRAHQYVGDYTQADILKLEEKLCKTEPYLSLGRYIHFWARRNDAN